MSGRTVEEIQHDIIRIQQTEYKLLLEFTESLLRQYRVLYDKVYGEPKLSAEGEK